MKILRVVLPCAAVVALGFVFWLSYAQAQDKALVASVQKIADLIEKGDEAAAKKEAAALGKKLGEVHDIMALMRPRKTKGIGVGNPGEVTPDGIEKKIQALSRDAVAQGVLDKEAGALKKMAYHVAAIAEVSLALPPEKDMGKKTKKLWLGLSNEMRSASVDFAKAVDGKAPAAVKTAASKLNTNCNNCHSEFRN